MRNQRKKPSRERLKRQRHSGATHLALKADHALLQDVRTLIDGARSRISRTVNSELVLLYWRIGRRIREEVLGRERAAYGERVIESLAQSLSAEYGKGFTRFALSRMITFATQFPEEKIVATLSQQLGWSHVVEIIALKDPLQRDFYAAMCSNDKWSVRTLRDRIRTMLFERTALSRKPEELARRELRALKKEDRLSPDLVFRDPYLLDFLGLPRDHSEGQLEAAILRELERFLLELGTDFTFVERQKRMSIGGEDFYLDLLFFHRGLRALVALELKLGRFSAEHKGQMELYLRWLDKYERKPGEAPPLGLILCSSKNEEQVELLQLGASSIRVAEYLTQLPPKPVLEAQLHRAVQVSRRQIVEDSPDKLQVDRQPRSHPTT